MVNFWSSVFLLPKSFYSKVDSLCSAFLWRNNSSATSGARVSWVDVCKPKEEGGLGIRLLEDYAQVFRLKHVWNLFSSKDSLWVAWLRKNVFGRKDFWETEVTSRLSKHVRSMLQVKHLLSNFMSCRLGNGRTSSFWHDSWSDLGALISSLGASGPRLLRIPLHGRVYQAVDNGNWKLPAARSQAAVDLQVTLASLSPPNDEAGEDIYLWKSSSGDFVETFSSRATWNNLRSQSQVVPWHKSIWFSSSIPRCSFVAWLVMRQRLPTRDRLRRWGMQIPEHCVLCSSALESHDHLFFNCTFSRGIWLHLTRNILPPAPVDLDNATRWTLGTQSHTAVPSASLNKITKLMLQVTLYTIWKERNARVFTNARSSVTTMRQSVDRTLRDRFLSLPQQRVSSSSLLLYYFACTES